MTAHLILSHFSPFWPLSTQVPPHCPSHTALSPEPRYSQLGGQQSYPERQGRWAGACSHDDWWLLQPVAGSQWAEFPVGSSVWGPRP